MLAVIAPTAAGVPRPRAMLTALGAACGVLFQAATKRLPSLAAWVTPAPVVDVPVIRAVPRVVRGQWFWLPLPQALTAGDWLRRGRVTRRRLVHRRKCAARPRRGVLEYLRDRFTARVHDPLDLAEASPLRMQTEDVRSELIRIVAILLPRLHRTRVFGECDGVSSVFQEGPVGLFEQVRVAGGIKCHTYSYGSDTTMFSRRRKKFCEFNDGAVEPESGRRACP